MQGCKEVTKNTDYSRNGRTKRGESAKVIEQS
jgi:hypothetical protein